MKRTPKPCPTGRSNPVVRPFPRKRLIAGPVEKTKRRGIPIKKSFLARRSIKSKYRQEKKTYVILLAFPCGIKKAKVLK